MSSARKAIQALEALRERLVRPLDFYAAREKHYRELAQTTALQVLVNLRPASADPGLWEKQAGDLAARVKLDLVTAENVGVIITLDASPDLPANSSRAFQLGGLSIDDVERFVAAGRGKTDVEAPGKNLDARDDGKSDLQIAWRIMYAIRLQKDGADRLLGHIMDFLAAERKDEMQSLLPQVLKAWLDVFPPIAIADWQSHVRSALP